MRVIFSESAFDGGLEEHRDLVEDAGRYLGFVRMVARRTAE